MEEVLLQIGTIVEIDDNDNIKQFIIIGKRCINPDSLKACDYVSIPVTGFEWNKDSNDDKVKFHSNLFYFNHYDIHKIQPIEKPVSDQVDNKSGKNGQRLGVSLGKLIDKNGQL